MAQSLLSVRDLEGKYHIEPIADPAYKWFSWPSWSPDGKKIAFVGSSDTDDQVLFMGRDGGPSQAVLSDLPGAFDYRVFHLKWSPDGKRMAFNAEVGLTRADLRSVPDHETYLFVMEADGTRPRTLCRNHLMYPDFQWHPDGGWIVLKGDFYSLTVVHGTNGFTQEIKGKQYQYAEDASWIVSRTGE